MNIDDENEIKKEFQLERVIFFSDAVFAIIITIMILDVKLPDVVQTGEMATKNAFIRILPKLTAYMISFFVVGNIWMKHLRIFSFLKDYDMKLVAINLLFLFSVSLFPFGLSFAFSPSNVMHYTWGIYTYVGIIYFTIFTQSLLAGYIAKNKEKLCVKAPEIDGVLQWRIRLLNIFLLPVFIVLVICNTYFGLSLYTILVLFVVYIALIRRTKKKYYPDEDKVTIGSIYKRLRRNKQPSQKKTDQIA
jgi:uncharacterized membrane protein